MTVANEPRHRRKLPAENGVFGNERLTALSGTLLLVGLAAEGLTLVSVRQFLTLHFFVGMLLIGPVLLKIASTGYRFVRYYTGAALYVRKGPPAPLMRLLGPLVILTSLAVFGTGVILGVVGPGSGPWLFLHKASFVLWFGCMSVHVLVYVWRLPRLLLGREAQNGSTRNVETHHTVTPRDEGMRWLLIGVALAGGLLLAFATVHQVGPWDARSVFG